LELFDPVYQGSYCFLAYKSTIHKQLEASVLIHEGEEGQIQIRAVLARPSMAGFAVQLQNTLIAYNIVLYGTVSGLKEVS
jgi:hypothetical protein